MNGTNMAGSSAGTKTHWKKAYNPNYFGAWCFAPGQDMVLTIASVAQEPVSDEKGKTELCMVVHWAENGAKPLICNKTNAKAIEKLVGSPYIEDWKGQRLQLYVDHNVRFGREKVDGVRIRPRVTMSQEPAPIICEECGKSVQGVGNYTAQQVAGTNKARYGVVLCAECSSRKKAEIAQMMERPQECDEPEKSDSRNGGGDEHDTDT